MKHAIAPVARMLFATLWLAASGCDTRKEEPLPEPTPESIVITGRIATGDDTPLAAIPLRVEYRPADPSASPQPLRKAEATSDADGRYRIFFELGEEADGTYALCALLGGLSEREYILPSDFDASNRDQKLSAGALPSPAPGDRLQIDLRIPRKRLLNVALEGYEEEGPLTVGNTIDYGSGRARMTFAAEGGRATVACALDADNALTLEGADGTPLASRRLYVDGRTDGLPPFENDRVPAAARFRLTKAGHAAPMGEDFPLAAPFDLVTFRITTADGGYEPLGFADFTRYYDSIVWRAGGLPDTMPVYRERIDSEGSERHFTSQWSSHFYRSGSLTTYLDGYCDGRVAYTDSLTIRLYERDFLCFDWTQGSISLTGGYTGIYCRLDRRCEFLARHPEECNGTRFTQLRMARTQPLGEAPCAEAEKALRALMEEHIGAGTPAAGKAGAFACLPEETEPVWFWENASTRVLLLREPASEFSEETCCLHAEAK